MRVKTMLISYALIGALSSGHWFANEYNEENMHSFAKSNPASSLIVASLWPIYVSYVAFKD